MNSSKSLEYYKFQRKIQMKITITDGNQVKNFQVDADQLVEDIKALVQVEFVNQLGVPFERSQLYYDGKLLNNDTKLNQAGITQGGLIFLSVSNFQQPKKAVQQQPKKGLGLANLIKTFDKKVKQQGGFSFSQISQEEYLNQAEGILQQLKGDEAKLATLRSTQPDIADCITNKDVKGLAKILKGKRQAKLKKIMEEEKRFQELAKDPMNPEYQRMLEERIHQQNIDKNLQFAQEYIPQVFGHIHMLYINAKINKISIQAFVDSGAQSTIMSESLAQRCGLMRLMDKRHAGTAVGVGSCKILGRIHAADIQIQGQFLTCAFTVIQNNSVEFLLGLDMLKRYACLIDLKKNQLNFQDGMIVTKFLSDGQIKKNAAPVKKQDIEPKLKKLSEMGFTKEESLAALQNCNYNEQVAGNILMQRKYGK